MATNSIPAPHHTFAPVMVVTGAETAISYRARMIYVAQIRPDPLSKRNSYLRIERVGQPTAPWLWKVYSADDVVVSKSRLGYRCAEDALKVGQVFLRKAQYG